MAVTYDDALGTDRDKVRFYLGDTAASAGPKPDAGNFSDNELAGLVSAEGSWQRAVAAGFEVLAALWAPLVDIAVGPRKESLSQTAAGFRAQAAEWRRRYGQAGGKARVVQATRADGYSSDIAADEV